MTLLHIYLVNRYKQGWIKLIALLNSFSNTNPLNIYQNQVLYREPCMYGSDRQVIAHFHSSNFFLSSNFGWLWFINFSVEIPAKTGYLVTPSWPEKTSNNFYLVTLLKIFACLPKLACAASTNNYIHRFFLLFIPYL